MREAYESLIFRYKGRIMKISKKLAVCLALSAAISPVLLEGRTIDMGTAYKTRGELGVGYNLSDTVQNLTLAFRTWNGEWTPVEVFFEKGYTGDGSNGSGVYNITKLQIDGGNYDDGFDNYQRCVLNIGAGAKVNMSDSGNISGALYATDADISMTYLNLNAYGIFNMQGGKLSLTGGDTIYSYKLAGKMTLNDVDFNANFKVVIDGGNYGASVSNNYQGYDLNMADVVFSGNTTFKGTELIVDDTNKLSLLDSASVSVNSLDASNLIVSRGAKVEVSSAAALAIENLNIILEDLSPLDFSEIFTSSDGETIVFSETATNISVSNAEGVLYDNVQFAYDNAGNIIGIAAVPEPAACAAMLGALALALAACRKRS